MAYKRQPGYEQQLKMPSKVYELKEGGLNCFAKQGF
jgi:hypothetical protein